MCVPFFSDSPVSIFPWKAIFWLPLLTKAPKGKAGIPEPTWLLGGSYRPGVCEGLGESMYAIGITNRKIFGWS